MFFMPLYIDPGTGSMLFSLAIGIATATVFGVRALFIKIRFLISGGKVDKKEDKKIKYLIFSDHKRYWNVFKPICDEFERRNVKLVYYTQSEDDPVFNYNYQFVKPEFIGEGNKGFIKMNMVNADTVISTTPGLDVLQWKRSKNVKRYIHIPHSCDDLSVYRMFALDYYDVFLTTGKNQADVAMEIESLRPTIKKKDIRIMGSSYMDQALEQVKTFTPHKINYENLTVLLAPSWGKNSLLSKYGEKLLDACLNTGFNIIVRPHPQSFTAEKEIMDSLMSKYPQIEWNKDNNNLEVLNRADMLITDFSGIIFDWSLLFNRPCIIAKTNFDTGPLDAAWLQHKPWILEAVEKIGISLKECDFPNMKGIILDALTNKDLEIERQNVHKECWENVGHASVDIVDYIIKISQ